MIGHGTAVAGNPTPALTRAARKEQTRLAVLDAAAWLFAQKGIEAASLEEIAQSIGLTRGAIYASFASKQALIDAVGERESIHIDLDCLWDVGLSLRDRLTALAERQWAMRHAHGVELVLKDLEFLLYSVRHADEVLQRRNEYRSAIRMIGAELERVAALRGEALPLPGELFATAMLALARGLWAEELRQQRTLTRKQLSQAMALLA